MEHGLKKLVSVLRDAKTFSAIEDELKEALYLYWTSAGRILSGSPIRLLEPPPGFYSLEKNFFSGLFLYSYIRAGIPVERRVLYSIINQCLRGMVTGCDNILDDEYKKTLDTDLPSGGVKFRSIVDIMASDRVLFEFLLEGAKKGLITHGQALAASSATLKALAQSGAQEASEECGVDSILSPDEVLKSVHHYKTGVLFKCPWAVPSIIEDLDRDTVKRLEGALYSIGMGCQILDDMVDLALDLDKNRHNYVVSLISHGSPDEREGLSELMNTGIPDNEREALLLRFPQSLRASSTAATGFLRTGLKDLFAPEHAIYIDPAVAFLSGRIGASRFLTGV